MSAPVIPTAQGATYRLCFVCTGNICRSPMAEVALLSMARATPLGDGHVGDRLVVSSAGTGNWHEGEPMDPRARQALEAAGYRDHGHVAHQFDLRQIGALDLIVALDRRHLGTLKSLAEPDLSQGRLVLLRNFDRSSGGAVDVPDPYYGDSEEFARCLAMIEAGCRGLLAELVSVLTAVRGSPVTRRAP